MDGSKIVSSAILGYDFRRILVNGKDYTIAPPTIHKFVGAYYWLSEIGDGNSLKEMFTMVGKLDNLCRALSFLINGDENLAEELSHGTMDEVVDGLVAAFDLISTENFLKLSALLRSARKMIAKQR